MFCVQFNSFFTMSNVKILVCCHKKDLFKRSMTYMPIHVGKTLSSEDLNIVGDDTGDNISRKNPSYCELTGMYWAWKNLKDVDFVGLCHYRRYFDFNHYGSKWSPVTTVKTELFDEVDTEIDESSIHFLINGGVIMAKPLHLVTSSYYQYCEWHHGKDMRLLLDVMRRTQPSKYVSAFYETIFHSNIFRPYNMFVMKWEQFDRYCNWIFPILEMMEKEIDVTGYTQYQKRIYGYVAERLLNLYIVAEKLRIKDVPIIKFSDDLEVNDKSMLKFYLKSYIRDFSFKVLTHAM